MPNQTPIDALTLETLAIRQEADLMVLTRLIRQQAALVGMNTLYQTKLVTATSELARNMLNYASGGITTIEQVRQGARTGIRLTFADQGPGIADIDLAMQDGYSSASSLGVGLPGARRLVDNFSLTSVVGEGTTVTLILWSL